MTLTPEQVAAVGAIVGAVVVAGIRKVWVWGWVFAAMEKDRDFWRDAYFKQHGLTDHALTVGEKAVSRADG